MSFMRRIKYLWFIVVMKLTWCLPDWIPVMRLRGVLINPCFQRCGRNFQIASTAMVLNSAEIELGDNVYIGYGCWIQGIGGVVIQDDVMLGPYTTISTGNHTLLNGSYRYGPSQRAPVVIGRGSWIGAGVNILAGVTIGSGALCAAGSVITKSVGDLSVVGGVPAKELAGSRAEGGS